ncbi:MAG: flavin reductase family protein [bacterium]|nr:flavin reductase family protein [bacterium]
MKKSLGSQTLVYPTPVWIIGSYDKSGKPNAMAVAWGGVCCSKPACVTISLRKATYTYGCIMERQAYTVNVPSEKYAKEADYFGVASGREVNKFAQTGLTAVHSNLVDAPYIAEFPLILECKVIHTHEIGLHTQFIGEILDVKADPEILDDKDNPLIQKIRPIIYAPGLRQYLGIGELLGIGYKLGKDVGK